MRTINGNATPSCRRIAVDRDRSSFGRRFPDSMALRSRCSRHAMTQSYWLAPDATPICGATLSLVAVGALTPAVPVVSFEAVRLHATVPPASAAMNAAANSFFSARCFISPSLASALTFCRRRDRNTAHFCGIGTEFCGMGQKVVGLGETI